MGRAIVAHREPLDRRDLVTREHSLPSRAFAFHIWIPSDSDQPSEANLDFLVELIPFSNGIETRKILSRITPWAAISLRNTKIPASFFNALENRRLT